MRSIWSMEQSIGNWLVRDYQRRTLRSVKIRALAAFIVVHPKWHEHLFDEHFLSYGAVRVLDGYLQGRAPTPAALAEAWAEQWGWQAQTREQHVAEATPICAAFLTLLEVELGNVYQSTPEPVSISSSPVSSIQDAHPTL